MHKFIYRLYVDFFLSHVHYNGVYKSLINWYSNKFKALFSTRAVPQNIIQVWPQSTRSIWKSSMLNKHQIQSSTRIIMDDLKTICIYEKLLVFAYFLINGRIYLVSLGNPSFSNMFPHARYVLITFDLWTLCACLGIFSLYFFIFSCHISKHPSLCELFWYPSPDDGD